MGVTARLAANVGKGLAAGLVGTAAMTLSSTLEMKLRDRAASGAPATAVAKVLGIKEFETDTAESRFGSLVHWGYGTGWGAARGALGTFLPSGAATVGHMAAVWGSEQIMLPALDVAPPATQWGAKEIAIDGWHHLVYVLVTAKAYNWLSNE